MHLLLAPSPWPRSSSCAATESPEHFWRKKSGLPSHCCPPAGWFLPVCPPSHCTQWLPVHELSIVSAATTPSLSPIRQDLWAGCPDALRVLLPGYIWGKSSASKISRQNPIYQTSSCPRGKSCSSKHQSSRVLAGGRCLLLPGVMAVAALRTPRFVNHTSLFSLKTQKSSAVLRMLKTQGSPSEI